MAILFNRTEELAITCHGRRDMLFGFHRICIKYIIKWVEAAISVKTRFVSDFIYSRNYDEGGCFWLNGLWRVSVINSLVFSCSKGKMIYPCIHSFVHSFIYIILFTHSSDIYWVPPICQVLFWVLGFNSVRLFLKK